MASNNLKAHQADPILQEIDDLKERMLKYAAEQKRLAAELQENIMRMKDLLAKSRQSTEQTKQQARRVLRDLEKAAGHTTHPGKQPFFENYSSDTPFDGL